MITPEEIALESLLLSFPDYQDRLYRLQKKLLQTSGVIINITPFQFFLQKDTAFGGNPPYTHNFFIILKEVLGSSIFFPNTILKTFEDIFFFDFNSNYLHSFDNYTPIDHCPRLQMRNHSDLIVYFEDESFNFELFCGEELIGQWINNSFFSTSSPDELQKKIDIHGLALKVKLAAPRKERIFFENEILNISKVIPQCWNTFYKLANNPYYFSHIKSILKSFNKLSTDLSLANQEDFYNQIKNLSFYDFKTFDPFDWRQLLFCFSIVGNFELQKRAERIKFIRKIKVLESTGEILYTSISSSKEHLLFKDSYEK